MSDFDSGAWSLFVAGMTVLSLLACLLLLVIASRRKVMAQDNSTGHVWDEDLREMNNLLPLWWMWLFVITVVFSGGYLAFYPGLGSLPGALQWSSAGEFQAETEQHVAAMAPVYVRFEGQTIETMSHNATALAIGERLFLNQCAACHGSDARGSKGYPNLTDGDWLGGQGSDYIARVITEGRQGVMPPMGAALGGADQVKNVSNYVLSLSGSPHDSVAAALGQGQFGTCAACHGVRGQGKRELGAPDLTDKVWLHGYGAAAIAKIINEGKTNAMPGQARSLTLQQVRVLTAYVLSLSAQAGASPLAKP